MRRLSVLSVVLFVILFLSLPAEALDLGGYVLAQSNAYRAFTIPPGTTIVPGGYLVVGRNAAKAAFETKWGVTLATNVIYINASNNIPRIDGYERFAIHDAGNTNLDGWTPTTIDPAGKSVQRKNATNNPTLSASWNVVTSGAATPGSGGVGDGTAGLVISEYADNSSFSYEFVELFYDAAGLPSNIPPILLAIENQFVTISNQLQFNVIATPTDSDPVTLSLSNAPAGAVFNSTNENGTFSWASASPLGVYTTLFYAVDENGASTQAVVISVLPPPTVSFAAPEITTTEDIGTQAVQVVLSRPGAATVSVSYAGTALYGVSNDYTIASTTVVFTAGGSTQATVQVVVNNDAATEGVETVILNLNASCGCALGSPTQSIVFVRDNDAISILTANLVSGYPAVYREPGCRILQGLKPDICAIQEWNITSATDRAFVDENFGTNYYYYKEPQATNFFPQPNGVVSRWPIKAAGEWSDAETVNRDFVWSTIDIPGDRDLHVVNVHLYYSGGEGPRELEARAVTNYVALAGWPSNDYVVLCGDLNTVTYGEPCYQVLTNVFSDSRRPKDQYGDIDTSRNRDQRFDYVMPKPLLNSNHYTVTISGSNFADGLVFDTRLWTNGTPLPVPVLVNDSAATGNAHMAVMKAFSLGRTPPSLHSVPEQHVLENGFLQIAVQATPTDGDTVTLTASNLPAGAVFSSTNENGTLTWTNPSPAGIYEPLVFATDADGTEQQVVTIHVLVDGRAWINEIHYDNASTDTNEGVEIAGTAGMDLSLFTLYGYNGDDGSIYASNVLSGYIDDEGCGYGAVWVPITGLQQGPDGVALVQYGTSVVQFLSYEGIVTAVEGPAIEMSSIDIGVAEDGARIGQSLQLTGEGTNDSQFTWGDETNAASAGLLNLRQTISPCSGPTNVPPTFYYIGPYSVVQSHTLSFQVSAWDADGDTISLSVSNAPAGAWFTSTNENGTFTWTNAAPLGVYTSVFFAVDKDGSNSETVLITVATGTEKPVLQAIGNKSVIVNLPLGFDIVATDAEGDPITYTAAGIPAGASFTTNGGSASFSWPSASPVGIYTSRFYAADDDGTSSVSVTMTVTPATNLPALQPIGARWVWTGDTLSFDVTATDVDGEAISLAVSNAPAGASFSSSGASGTFTWTNAAPLGVYTSTFYAVGDDGVDLEIVEIKVVLNAEPWINEIHYDNVSTDTNEGVEVAGKTGIDLSLYAIYAYNGADGEYYAVTNLSGTLPDEGCGYGAVWVPIAGLQQGPDGVALVRGGSNPVEFLTYEGVFTASNGPLTGVLSLDIKVSEKGTETNMALQLTGYGTNMYGFVWAGPTNAASPGLLNSRQTLYPCGSDTNQPPLLMPIGDRLATENSPYGFTVAAVDCNNDPVTLTVSNAPADSLFTPVGTNATFVWTNPAPVGVYTMTFYAADATGADSETVLLTVLSSATNPPVLAAISDKNVVESNTVTFAVTATELDGDPVTLSVSNAPAGSDFTSTDKNGTFTWTNAAPVGVYTTLFYAVDKDGTDSELVVITVQAAPPISADTLVLYDFQDGSGVFTNSADSTHSNVTATAYEPNDGTFTDAVGSSGRAISDTSWNSTSHYYTFSITIDPAYQLTVTGLQFASYRSGTGPSNWVLRSSSDNYAGDLAGGVLPVALVWSTNSAAVSLSGLSGTVIFRLFGTNASSSAGTWRNDDVRLTGLAEPAPSTDDDGDGLPNDWESLFFDGPTNATAGADDDTDGLNNWGEYLAGTNPTNDQSLFTAEAFWSNAASAVHVDSLTNRRYNLYVRTNLLLGAWEAYRTNISGVDGVLSIPVTNLADSLYYRPSVDLP